MSFLVTGSTAYKISHHHAHGLFSPHHPACPWSGRWGVNTNIRVASALPGLTLQLGRNYSEPPRRAKTSSESIAGAFPKPSQKCIHPSAQLRALGKQCPPREGDPQESFQDHKPLARESRKFHSMNICWQNVPDEQDTECEPK